ncbi:hypothetical protein SAY86_005865 [Trapa natans]|uniref:Suppressor of RPS4-RLD 1 n=1 Tax=Trapa natans TaxID=22666 RepID=A0AAN7L0Q2_TRANT|nr:hypothetical protein SAY86_005865 [Trapa natans]
MGGSTEPDRVELARFCRSRDWSKAIRVLDSIVARSSSTQDLCFHGLGLEIHQNCLVFYDTNLIENFTPLGRALLALGKKMDATLAWKKGYEHAFSQSADLNQIMELEELLTLENKDQTNNFENHAVESTSSLSPLELTSQVDDGSSNAQTNKNNMIKELKSYSKLNGQLEDESKPCCNLEMSNRFSDESRQSEKFNANTNGSLGGSDTMSNDGRLEELSLSCSNTSISSSDVTDVSNKVGEKSIQQNDGGDKDRRSKKFCVTRISKNKSISVDFRLSRGIAEVNDGRYAHAISIFDQILREDPTYPEALIGRGTAYAFQRELDSAVADFSKAIQANPSAVEAWKRRGQARAALGSSAEAIADLTKALYFEPNSVDILHERGIINFKFKDFDAAVEDLSYCVNLDKDNKSAHTYLGLALSAIGEYIRAEEAHMKAIQLDQNFLEAWANLTQFYHEIAKPAKSLECIQRILQIDKMFAKVYHLYGLLLHGMGDHSRAIKELSTGLSIENNNIECLYLRGSCYHAIGDYVAAVSDYDAVLDQELDSVDKFVLQCLAFYQKEIALYTASKVSSDFCLFDIDGDLDPLFKEYWCKRLHPKNVCEKVYRQPPLCDSMRKGKLKKQDFAMTKQKATLLLEADSIGKKIQYDCPGFLPNRRQHRMAGLAAIEIAQKVSKVWRSIQTEWRNAKKGSMKSGKRARRKERIIPPSQNRGGACCSTSSSSETYISNGSSEDRSSARGMISWQDVYAVAVKWRQISEPCDPVVWINKLSEEFNAGFGSRTPMILGKAKVIRYYPNCERTLNVAKTVIKEKHPVHNKKDDIIDLSKEGKLEEIMDAISCSDLYKAVGEDFWLATWCNSTAFEGKQLEGTRITTVKMEHGFDFAIRTPCTPARWEDFDAEMQAAWENICNTFCGENYASTDFDVLVNTRDAILRMTYYWYNFMPLARGTAAVGFIVLLGLLLAANMEFTGSIPKGLQVDWEAILNFDPSAFIDSVKSWLYPSLSVSTSWKDYPDVMSTFSTTGSVVAALSQYDDKAA